MREFSWTAIILGVLIGCLLGAANAFVGLQVGMTISASIPAAVMSLLILRTLLKRGTLLESNMVQTVGSAGETVAAGMIFTIPALFMMDQNPEYLEMVIWGGIGGLLGICFMVPLRHILIVKEHGVLTYPEGVACAEVLQSGERGGEGARSVIWGALVGGVYFMFTSIGCWGETGKISIRRFRTELQLDSSPALLGVGYILGARVAAYMLAGAILSWFVLIPSIAFFGADVTAPIFPATAKTISQMSPQDMWDNYIRYIGAGAVAIGGLISLFKSFPTILSAMVHMLSGMFRWGKKQDRTEKDFPFPLLILMVGGLAYLMWRFQIVTPGWFGVGVVLLFTFFFVTVSSRLVGIVGSSSNPISGMTIATLLATALVYKIFVMDRAGAMADTDLTALKVSCLTVGAIVCVAISIAGDTSQDLKTGFLLKATPYKQQIGEMIGVITAVVTIAGVMLLLNNTYGFGEKTAEHPQALAAYQANIMRLLVDGVLGGQVPWTLIMIGGAAAIIVELLGLPALPFAVGMYLPLGLSAPIMVGGIIRWSIDRRKRSQTDHDPGVLTASGFVAGQGLMGVALAGLSALIAWVWASPQWLNPSTGAEEAVGASHLVPWIWSKLGFLSERWGLGADWWAALPLIPFVPLAIWLWMCARRRPPIKPPAEPLAPAVAGPAPAPVPPPAWAPSSEVKPASDPQAPVLPGDLGLSAPTHEGDPFASSSADADAGSAGEPADKDHQEGDEEPDALAGAPGEDWGFNPDEEPESEPDREDDPDDWPPPTNSTRDTN